MPNDDKIGTIVNDPDFKKLSVGDQQKFLSEVDPDFGKLKPDQFSSFLKQYNGAKESVPGAPNGLPEVPTRETYQNIVKTGQDPILERHRMIPGPGGGFPQNYSMKESEARKAQQTNLGIMGGVLAGEVAVPAVAGLPWIIRTLGTAEAIGFGTGAGELAAGAKPKEALESSAKASAGGVVTGAALEGLGVTFSAAKSLIRPFLQKAPIAETEAALANKVGQRAFELAKMSDAEEGIRQSVVAAPRAIRQNVLAKIYPKIDEPVDIYASAKQAVESSGKQIAHGTPSQLSKTIRIGKQIDQIEGVVKDLLEQDRSISSDPMQQAELLDTLQALKDKRTITFTQARNLRSALGTAIAKGQGYKIPAETYQTLRSVYSLVNQAIEDAAERAGKLGDLVKADKVYKQFMNDFYNKNAPLRNVIGLKEGMTGRTIRRLVAPENINRAEAALRRWGMTDQADALRQIADMPDRKQAIREMEELLTSPSGFKSAKIAEAREADVERVEAGKKELSQQRKNRLKILGTGGAAYEGYRLLRGEKK